MTISFDNYRFEDGSIKKLVVEEADVRVHVLNWREELDVLLFRDVVGMECFSMINTSLSHGEEAASDPLLARCCMVGQESPSEFRCFNFFSAWTDVPILKIIARSFKLESS